MKNITLTIILLAFSPLVFAIQCPRNGESFNNVTQRCENPAIEWTKASCIGTDDSIRIYFKKRPQGNSFKYFIRAYENHRYIGDFDIYKFASNASRTAFHHFSNYEKYRTFSYYYRREERNLPQNTLLVARGLVIDSNRRVKSLHCSIYR